MRIWLTASHGCGKSTLTRNFQNQIEEIARGVIAEKWHPDTLSKEELDDFELVIMKRQIEAEQNMKDWFVSDRTVIDVLAYANTMCRPSMTARLKEMAEMHLEDNPYDLVFYIPIEFPLEKDWTRFEDDSYQKIIDLQILKYLKRYKIPYITLTGTVEERLRKIEEESIKYFTKNS